MASFINVDDIFRLEKDPIRAAIEEELNGGVPPDDDGEEPEPFDVSAFAGSLGAAFDAASPALDDESVGLSEDEERRLERLQARQQRLQPLQLSNEPISRRIPGNPFSIEVGPGLRNVAAALVNRERRTRLFGDPDAQQEFPRLSRRMESLQARKQEIANQMAAQNASSTLGGTFDEEATRRLTREQERIDRQLQELKARARETAGEGRGIAFEARDLQERRQLAQQAQVREQERATARQEFITENVGKALQEQVKTASDREVEQLKTFNKFQLQERLFQLRGALEKTKSKLGSPDGRREYASAVNQYARTFLQMADTYDNDIKAAQRLIESFGYVPGDEEYETIQSQIDQAKSEKQKVLNEALKIYENSTVLGEDTRVFRQPTEEDKQKVQEMKQHGFSDDQIDTFAKGLGFRFDPEEFGGTTQQPDEEEVSFGSVDDVFNYYQQTYDMDRSQVIQRVMESQGLNSEDEAIRYLEQNIQQ